MAKNLKQKSSDKVILNKRIENLCGDISGYIYSARRSVLQTINTEMVKVYWLIGRDIVEEEQSGKERAEYGKNLVKELSNRLQKKFGKGFGLANIKNFRRFYLSYQINGKSYAVHSQLNVPKFKRNLGWTHYRSLMRIKNKETRNFYEIESSKNNWSSRELDRQINSLLFERLARSKDKKGLMQLIYKGQEIVEPSDVIKDPVVLEFLNIPESHKLVESELETALITSLQKFLLELGRGFAYIGRQKRLTIDGKNFYCDLIFYHTILKAYVIIDVKTHEVTHADLGQIQLYRNYYDMECLSEGDNPTIGLILCTEKSDKMVKYFLKNDDKIFASKYMLNLPTAKELEKELKREIEEIKNGLNQRKKYR